MDLCIYFRQLFCCLNGNDDTEYNYIENIQNYNEWERNTRRDYMTAFFRFPPRT
jgi:hypothetical protein